MAIRQDESAVETYYRVRRAVGYLGLALPVILIIGGFIASRAVEPSISDYYHTLMRDLYVGVIAGTGVFLLAYTGYAPDSGEKVSDNTVTTVAGLSALGVAFFPNLSAAVPDEVASFWQFAIGRQITAYVHYISAFIFLGSLGYMSYAKFSKTEDAKRARLFRVCGLVTYAATLGVIVTSALKLFGPAGGQKIVTDWLLILWFEALGVWAFSVAWLVKGKADEGLRRLLGQSGSTAGS